MHHNEFIIASLAFPGRVGGRLGQQDYYETHGRERVVWPALSHAVTAFRAALRRLGKEAKSLDVGSRAYAAQSIEFG